MKLVVSPQAADDIEVAVRWWVANRPAAPELLEKELLRVLDFIARVPGGGTPLRAAEPPGVRRVPLLKSRYLLYYRVLESEGVIRVLRLWHSSRGTTPKL